MMTDWIKISQMKPEELEAAVMVELFWIAMKEAFARLRIGDVIHFLESDLDIHFPAFANSLGLSGALYQNIGGKCPAVSIYLESDTRDQMLFFVPNHSQRTQEILDQREDGGKIRKGVLAICRDIRPGWGWPED
jgi:hypothetical protein